MTMVPVILRAVAYTASAAACRLASQAYFAGSDVAFLSLFVLAAFVAEFAFAALNSPSGTRPSPGVSMGRLTWRTVAFCGVLLGLIVMGSTLVSSAMTVRASDPAPAGQKCDILFKEPPKLP